MGTSYMEFVALLAEGVDRNIKPSQVGGTEVVALLAEGVDRNVRNTVGSGYVLQSPSSRRAWIEIYAGYP